MVKAHTFGAFLSPNGGWRVGAWYLIPRVGTHPLGPYSHWFFTRLLCLFSPQVFIHTLPLWGFRVFTCLLWGVLCCSLVALFLLVPSKVKPWGERSGLRRVSLLVYEDFRASRLVDGSGRASGCCGAWEFMPCARCIKVASIRCTTVLTASTPSSTYVKRCVCSSSSMVDSGLFWVGPWTCS